MPNSVYDTILISLIFINNMMNIYRPIRKEIALWKQAILHTFFPMQCIGCNQWLSASRIHPACARCQIQIHRSLKQPLCRRCQIELPAYDTATQCQECRSTPRYFRHALALVKFNDLHQLIFHAIKFKRREYLIEVYRNLITRKFSVWNGTYDILSYVPLSPWRQLHRGFNQSELISHMIQRARPEWQLRRLLGRKKWSRPQSWLASTERRKNIQNQFTLRPRQVVTNRKILLVDDIFTTGSTVNECARILRLAGARQVDVFVIARAF